MEKRYPIVSKEYMQAVDKARQKLRALVYNENRAPWMLRLAWQPCAVTYDETGAPNDVDLALAKLLLELLKEQFPIVSRADLYQLAGVVAVQVAGGPHIPFHPGRKDKEELLVYCRLPDETKGGNYLMDVFADNMGLEDKDIVTLSAGFALASRYKRKAYMYGSKKPYPYFPPVFDNRYFKNILDGQDNGLLPPPAYRVLLKDPLLSLVKKYAADEDAFFADYAVSHMKLSELGFAEG